MRNKKKYILLGVLVLIILIALSPLRHAFSLLYGVYVKEEIELVNEENDTTNILLLGTAGAQHDGGDLTDTIILAHVNRKNNAVYLISIPRDLWIKNDMTKINSLYALEKLKEDVEDPFLPVMKTVEEITGLPVHYAIDVDFNGFVSLVDSVDGIDVPVENFFVDNEYPVKGMEEDLCGKDESELEFLSTMSSQLEAFPCRYKTVQFAEGVQKMNGEQALEFVRSRHAQGSEGTDFARSRRQQLVLKALKDRVLSLGIIFNPPKVFDIYNIVKDNIQTTIQKDEIDDFIKLAQEFKEAKIESIVIDYGDEQQERYGLLMNPELSEEYGYKWVLVPRIGNGEYIEIQSYIACIIEGNNCEITKDTVIVKKPEGAEETNVETVSN